MKPFFSFFKRNPFYLFVGFFIVLLGFNNCSRFEVQDFSHVGLADQESQASSLDGNENDPFQPPSTSPQPSPQPSTDPSNSSKLWPNEPKNFKKLTEFGFDTMEGGGWKKAVDGGNIIDDLQSLFSPGRVTRFTWNHRTVGSYPKHYTYLNEGTGVKEMYLAFYWKLSDPFTGWHSNQNKIALIWNDAPGTARPGKWYFGFEGQQGSNTFRRVEFSNYPQNNCHLNSGRGDCPGSYNLRPNRNNPVIALGKWHLIEIYGKIGSCDSCNDGIYKTWMDGVLLHDFDEVNYPGPFHWIQITPVWDAPEPQFPDAVDHHYWDHIRISVP